MMRRCLLLSAGSLACVLGTPAPAQEPDQPQPAEVASPPPANPYGLQPFHADFPVALVWPNVQGAAYDRTRRQMLERLAANLQGNVRREAWQMAMEFYWRAPEDAVEPLIAAMDRAFGNPALADVVKNCVEAMGKMADERLEGALLRAVEHKSSVVRQAAFAALARSGTTTALRAMYGWFPQMDARARAAWLSVLGRRLDGDGRAMLRELMMADFPVQVRDQVLKETLVLPAPQAAEILRGRWPEAVGEFKAIIAGVLHAAGDEAGTVWLGEALEGEDVSRLVLALRHCAVGDLGRLRPLVLRASAHLRPEVRLELATTLKRVEGDDVADVYEVLANPDEVWEIKKVALRELTRRGRGRVVAAMLEDLRTATGTRLQLLIHQLAESGDGRVVPELLERCGRAVPEERRPYLQALAQNRSEAAARALLDLFTGPEQVIGKGHGRDHTTTTYVPTLLLNLRGHEALVLDRYRKLPAEDWRRRALLLPTLTGLAVDCGDPAVAAQLLEPVRESLFAAQELPQIRVQCLNLLVSRWITVDDALKLKHASQREGPAMRALLQDFLNDYF